MLTLYNNIKKRREELGLTKVELATRIGYERSMITKIEQGKVDLTQSKILAFANALETTPAYLMGWEDNSSTATDSNVNLNEEFFDGQSDYPILIDFLDKLDHLMDKKHLNKSTLSKACNIPYTTIDGWYKKGYEGLKLTTLKKLADFFGTSLDYWVTEEDQPNKIKTENSVPNDFEWSIIEKYRDLDEHGKEMVDFVLNKEHERVSEEYVEFAARGGKYKVKKDVAVEWAKQVVNDPCERDDDLC